MCKPVVGRPWGFSASHSVVNRCWRSPTGSPSLLHGTTIGSFAWVVDGENVDIDHIGAGP